ncbi:MAG: hypothetical protein V7750_04265 [Sneathiella sp.]
MSKNPIRIKLNSLQSKTLAILQQLAKHPDSSEPVADSASIRITKMPHAHGAHMHVGDVVVSAKDASGLSNKSVWIALQRKGLVEENWEQEIIITSEGLALSTGLEDKFMNASDH